MDDTGDKMDLGLLLLVKYVDYRGRYGTRPSFYTPLCCFLSFSISRWSPHFVTYFLLLQRCKVSVLYLLDRELTALNLSGMTSLHLLTARVGLLLLKSVRLFLQTTGIA